MCLTSKNEMKLKMKMQQLGHSSLDQNLWHGCPYRPLKKNDLKEPVHAAFAGTIWLLYFISVLVAASGSASQDSLQRDHSLTSKGPENNLSSEQGEPSADDQSECNAPDNVEAEEI